MEENEVIETVETVQQQDDTALQLKALSEVVSELQSTIANLKTENDQLKTVNYKLAITNGGEPKKDIEQMLYETFAGKGINK